MNTELLFGTEAERQELVTQMTERADDETEDHMLPITPICTLTRTWSILAIC
jgi:hypothetical protein